MPLFECNYDSLMPKLIAFDNKLMIECFCLDCTPVKIICLRLQDGKKQRNSLCNEVTKYETWWFFGVKISESDVSDMIKLEIVIMNN